MSQRNGLASYTGVGRSPAGRAAGSPPGRPFQDRREYIPVGFERDIPVAHDPEKACPAAIRPQVVPSASDAG